MRGIFHLLLLISVFSTLQYLNTILIEKDELDAFKAFTLTRLINWGVTIITFLAKDKHSN